MGPTVNIEDPRLASPVVTPPPEFPGEVARRRRRAMGRKRSAVRVPQGRPQAAVAIAAEHVAGSVSGHRRDGQAVPTQRHYERAPVQRPQHCKRGSYSDRVGGVAAARSAVQPRFRRRQSSLALPHPDRWGHVLAQSWAGFGATNARDSPVAEALARRAPVRRTNAIPAIPHLSTHASRRKDQSAPGRADDSHAQNADYRRRVVRHRDYVVVTTDARDRGTPAPRAIPIGSRTRDLGSRGRRAARADREVRGPDARGKN